MGCNARSADTQSRSLMEQLPELSFQRQRQTLSGAYQMCKAALDQSDPARYRKQLDSLNRWTLMLGLEDSEDIKQDRRWLDQPAPIAAPPCSPLRSSRKFLVSKLSYLFRALKQSS